MDCIIHARFKHARFHSAVTPGLIALTFMGTGLIYPIVNNQNKACGSSPTEHFILSMAGSVGSVRAIPPLMARYMLQRFARASRGLLREAISAVGRAPVLTRLILLSLYPVPYRKSGSKLSTSLVK